MLLQSLDAPHGLGLALHEGDHLLHESLPIGPCAEASRQAADSLLQQSSPFSLDLTAVHLLLQRQQSLQHEPALATCLT